MFGCRPFSLFHYISLFNSSLQSPASPLLSYRLHCSSNQCHVRNVTIGLGVIWLYTHLHGECSRTFARFYEALSFAVTFVNGFFGMFKGLLYCRCHASLSLYNLYDDESY